MASTKTTSIIYWVSTGLVCLMMVASAAMYLTADEAAKAFTHLGFPGYFRVELAIAKLLGVVGLLAPLPVWIKEWAYAGFTINFISAFIAHSAVDGPQDGIGALVFLVLLIVSRVYWLKLRGATRTS